MVEWFNLNEWVDWIAGQDPGLGVLLITAGILFLMYGWRLSRFMVAFSTAIMLAGVTGFFAPRGWQAVAAVLAAAVLGGAVGARWVRIGIALSAGGWSAALLLGAMLRGGTGTGPMTIGCIIAFVAVASMSFAAMRPCVAYVTSVQGTVLFVAGSMILCARFTSWWGVVRDAVQHNPIFLPFCILAGTVIGYYVQLAEMQEKETGMAVM